jgi:hypothetical protein
MQSAINPAPQPGESDSLAVPARKRPGVLARRVAAAFYSAFIAVLLFGILPGAVEAVFSHYDRDLDQPLADRARGHLAFIESHLRQPFEGYGTTQVLAPQFAVVALSHMACGLMNVATSEPAMKAHVTPLLAELARRAVSPQVSPYRANTETVQIFGSHGLYLSHLNLILGCYRHVSGDSHYDALQRRVSEHLVAGCLADGDFHIQSYPGSAKWPADHTVTLCSLYLYDQTHGTHLSRAPIDGWLTYMRDHATDFATQLHRSCISPLSYARFPRGCGLSWSCLYMAQFAPEEAAQLYRQYRTLYAQTLLGCGGFREWPPGEDQGADVDSGPIIGGIGVAASGLGLGPTRIFQDPAQYALILRAAAVCGMPHVFGTERKYRLAPLLGEAILFDGVTATRWFGPVRETSFPRQLPFASGPLVFSILVLTVAGLIGWRIRRLLR